MEEGWKQVGYAITYEGDIGNGDFGMVKVLVGKWVWGRDMGKYKSLRKLRHLSFHDNFLCNIHSFDTFPLFGVFEALFIYVVCGYGIYISCFYLFHCLMFTDYWWDGNFIIF